MARKKEFKSQKHRATQKDNNIFFFLPFLHFSFFIQITFFTCLKKNHTHIVEIVIELKSEFMNFSVDFQLIFCSTFEYKNRQCYQGRSKNLKILSQRLKCIFLIRLLTRDDGDRKKQNNRIIN